jgi:serine/threonine protein kinase
MSGDDRFRRVRDLFEQALERPPEDRAAWIGDAADSDEQLRAEVLSLLEHDASVGSFLAEPAPERLLRFMADEPALEAGRTVGPYTVIREVGRGGMGRVYLARDARLGRMVALKAISPDVRARRSFRERLQREARAAATLAHPGICTVYALEEIDGELFIAAEFVEGDTLRAEIDRRQLPAAGEVVRTARILADALAHAHARGVTHRDLKPDNVMRTGDGRLKILDFGLAQLEAAGPESGADPGDGSMSPNQPGAEALTEPGALVGTPRYMSPEQLKGEPVDARADLFALGVLLYEYSTGVHPFDAPTPLGVVARILEANPRPLEAVRPDLPPSLSGAIACCLRRSPGDRLPSATAIVGLLAQSNGPPSGRHMTRWWRAHHLALIGLYLAAAAVAWLVKEWRLPLATATFVGIGVAATVGGVFRGHLLFVERVTGTGLTTERRLAARATLVTDVLIALGLAIDGILLTASRPLAGVLVTGLGAGIALARLVVEPSTTAATFERQLP